MSNLVTRVRIGLLLVAIVYQLLALIMAPQILLAAVNPFALVGLVFIAVAAFFCAKGLQEIAESILPNDGKPWYANPTGLGFLMVCFVLLSLVGSFLLAMLPLKHVPIPGLIFQFLALTLLCIVLLEGIRIDALFSHDAFNRFVPHHREPDFRPWPPSRRGNHEEDCTPPRQELDPMNPNIPNHSSPPQSHRRHR